MRDVVMTSIDPFPSGSLTSRKPVLAPRMLPVTGVDEVAEVDEVAGVDARDSFVCKQ